MKINKSLQPPVLDNHDAMEHLHEDGSNAGGRGGPLRKKIVEVAGTVKRGFLKVFQGDSYIETDDPLGAIKKQANDKLADAIKIIEHVNSLRGTFNGILSTGPVTGPGRGVFQLRSYIVSHFPLDQEVWQKYTQYLKYWNGQNDILRDMDVIEEMLGFSKKNPELFKILFLCLEQHGTIFCRTLLLLRHLYGTDQNLLVKVRDNLLCLSKKKLWFFNEKAIQEYTSNLEDFALLVEFLEGERGFDGEKSSEFKRKKQHGVYR